MRSSANIDVYVGAMSIDQSSRSDHVYVRVHARMCACISVFCVRVHQPSAIAGVTTK